MNRDKFFDVIITNDNLEKAYSDLKNVVIEGIFYSSHLSPYLSFVFIHLSSITTLSSHLHPVHMRRQIWRRRRPIFFEYFKILRRGICIYFNLN